MGQLHFHKLIKDINELEIWITEMLQIANDECYKDTSNLKGKKKQHISLLDQIDMKKVGFEVVLKIIRVSTIGNIVYLLSFVIRGLNIVIN